MSTENEGTPVPQAPSSPPVPAADPPADPAQLSAPQHTPAPAPGQAWPAPHAPAPAPAQAWPAPPHQAPYGNWGAPYQPPARRRGGLLAAALAVALVAGGVGGVLGHALAEDTDTSGSTTVSGSGTGGSVQYAAGTVEGVAQRALPSTVTIQAGGAGGTGGTGTGFVFDQQGHILTNNHVVAEAADGGRLTATFPDGKTYEATVLGRAQGYDVAVIKLKNAPSGLRPLPLGDSDKIAVGSSTIAIGAPFGLSNTVTTGIISAKNRPVASSDGGAGSKASYLSALQTDASINPGNSGGPLLDAHGNVIGINSAIQSTSGGTGGSGQAGSIGLGFAIPVNQAKYVAQQLIRTGKPVYAKIGAVVSTLDSVSGAKITADESSGAQAVEPGGPADQAGLKAGDVVTKLDDQVIDSGPTLIGEIWTHKPGDKVKVTYERDGKEHTADLTLGSRVGDS